MYIVLAIISIFVFLKTFFYGIYELKTNKNKLGSVFVFIFAFICLLTPFAYAFFM